MYRCLVEAGRCYEVFLATDTYFGSAYCQVLGPVVHPVEIDGGVAIAQRWVVRCVSYATGEPIDWIGVVDEPQFVVPIPCSLIALPDLRESDTGDSIDAE